MIMASIITQKLKWQSFTETNADTLLFVVLLILSPNSLVLIREVERKKEANKICPIPINTITSASQRALLFLELFGG